MRDGMRHRARDTRRIVTLEMIGAMLSLLLLVAAIIRAGATPTPPAHWHSITIVVRPGDTLWSIAQRCPVPGDTTPEKVRAIRDANGLRSASLAPGQCLSIPVISEDPRRDRMAELPASAGHDASTTHRRR